jgi:hypothetical protein
VIKIFKKGKENCALEHGVWRLKERKRSFDDEFWFEGTMSSVIAEHMGQGLTLVYAHVLPEIVVTTEILPTSLDGTLVRCNGS